MYIGLPFSILPCTDKPQLLQPSCNVYSSDGLHSACGVALLIEDLLDDISILTVSDLLLTSNEALTPSQIAVSIYSQAACYLTASNGSLVEHSWRSDPLQIHCTTHNPLQCWHPLQNCLPVQD